MTIQEISDVLEVAKEKKQRDIEDKLYENYTLAQNIIIFLGKSINGKKIPTFDELYPKLDEALEGEPQESNEWLNIKGQLLNFASNYNTRYEDKK